MNRTQLIWVVLLTFTFIVAILTTPILLITNSQNETTNNSGNNTNSCPEEFTGYCMNGGCCYYLEGVGGNRSKERDRKSELVFRSTYQIFEWDQTTRIEIFIT